MAANTNLGFEEYQRAQKLGQRDYREKSLSGRYPYLPVLDDILQNASIENQLPLGLVDIPLDRVIGTKTAGRTAAFASNYMPLLETKTEFAAKWAALCAAHLEEGIRDPIRCYEYMGRFYVQEGNKRVSVLKYFDAVAVPADVVRVLPRYSEAPEIRLYYEFLDAWPALRVYFLSFTQEGSYARLQKAAGKAPGEVWTDEERAALRALYARVEKAYYANGGRKRRAVTGDVLLLLLRLYPYEELQQAAPAELARRVEAVWDDILALEKPDPVAVSTAPAAPTAPAKLLDRLLPGILPVGHERLKVAFVHVRTAQTSAWTSQHEFGRSQLEKAFFGRVTTVAYDGADDREKGDELVQRAIGEGADIVFTTSPQLVGASLRAAASNPGVRILNCSMDMPYASIRTYYTRVYEAKFITGAIAGAMADGNRIGYVGDWPNLGVPANINAFALGARMVNPRARVVLAWTCLPGEPVQDLIARGIDVISGRDSPAPGRPQREFGTFQVQPDGALMDLASPFWHWGQYYENVVRTILDGGWSRDKSGQDGRAVNYWWGMNSGVMDVLFSRELPHDVRRLADILRSGLISGTLDPFACHITAQDGSLKNDGQRGFTPEQIIHMDWLCDAVDGVIPGYDDLTEVARPMYRMQGIHRDRLPPEKGAEL